MEKITISDVAQLAGVSISTASKTLNGTGSISTETIERVFDAAKTLGYTPNRAAQMLAAKNKTIGVLLPTEPRAVYGMFEEGLREALGGV